MVVLEHLECKCSGGGELSGRVEVEAKKLLNLSASISGSITSAKVQCQGMSTIDVDNTEILGDRNWDAGSALGVQVTLGEDEGIRDEGERGDKEGDDGLSRPKVLGG